MGDPFVLSSVAAGRTSTTDNFDFEERIGLQFPSPARSGACQKTISFSRVPAPNPTVVTKPGLRSAKLVSARRRAGEPCHSLNSKRLVSARSIASFYGER